MSHPDELAGFVRVVERGSFVAAAADLNITPSAMSKTISRLESRLGVQLLARTTRRLALTVEGETYLRRCREILASIEHAEAEITFSGGQLRGLIRINSGTAIGRHYLVHLVPEFLESHPHLKIELGITDRRIGLIHENTDIALRVGELASSSLVAKKIANVQRVICASPNYLKRCGTPYEPDDLRAHNCIRLAGLNHEARWMFRSTEGEKYVEIPSNIITDDADAMLDMAIAGAGIASLGNVSAATALRRGHLVPLLSECYLAPPTPIWALTPPGRNQVPRIRMFLDFLYERLSCAPWRLD
jgi:DNA-binding transcriptional LysR family regulator